MDELGLKRCIDICKDKANEMNIECDGGYVADEQTFEFESEGAKYAVTIEVYWEKTNWFMLYIESEDNSFKFKEQFTF